LKSGFAAPASSFLNAPDATAMDELIRRFDDLKPGPGYEPYCRPSRDSICRIEAHFGMSLPAGLIQFARQAKHFNGWFASLGRDYTNPRHIIRINSYWRRRRKTRAIPRQLVAFTVGFDEDLECFDLFSFQADSGKCEIRYWTPGVVDASPYASFAEYMEATVSAWEQARKSRRR
jgi:hypothetical protein